MVLPPFKFNVFRGPGLTKSLYHNPQNTIWDLGHSDLVGRFSLGHNTRQSYITLEQDPIS